MMITDERLAEIADCHSCLLPCEVCELLAALTEAHEENGRWVGSVWVPEENGRLKAVRQCEKCWRDTVSGDCYGCEADRLHARLAQAREAIRGYLNRYDEVAPLGGSSEPTPRDALTTLAAARERLRSTLRALEEPR